jgi:hypothetical protein
MLVPILSDPAHPAAPTPSYAAVHLVPGIGLAPNRHVAAVVPCDVCRRAV